MKLLCRGSGRYGLFCETTHMRYGVVVEVKASREPSDDKLRSGRKHETQERLTGKRCTIVFA